MELRHRKTLRPNGIPRRKRKLQPCTKLSVGLLKASHGKAYKILRQARKEGKKVNVGGGAEGEHHRALDTPTKKRKKGPKKE